MPEVPPLVGDLGAVSGRVLLLEPGLLLLLLLHSEHKKNS